MSNKNAETNRSFSWFLIIVILLLLTSILLWLSSIRFKSGEEIFYWQRFNSYLSGIWCGSWLLIPIILGVWVKIERKNFRYSVDRFAFSILLFFVCAFVNYSALFILHSVDHVGTVELKDNVYQLASITRYDDPVIYYLGKCDRSGYKCEFHRVYHIFYSVIHTPEIELSGDLQQLVVKMNGEIVYVFDGVKEICTETYIGDCINNVP